MRMRKCISCVVNGKQRQYEVRDTGIPFERRKLLLSAGCKEVGGLYVVRTDPPFSAEKGNGWVGNFPDMPTVLDFLRGLRAEQRKITELKEE